MESGTTKHSQSKHSKKLENTQKAEHCTQNKKINTQKQNKENHRPGKKEIYQSNSSDLIPIQQSPSIKRQSPYPKPDLLSQKNPQKSKSSVQTKMPLI